jgi:hypothetical protein
MISLSLILNIKCLSISLLSLFSFIIYFYFMGTVGEDPDISALLISTPLSTEISAALFEM